MLPLKSRAEMMAEERAAHPLFIVTPTYFPATFTTTANSCTVITTDAWIEVK